ncbi:MAG: SoxR reducing system RseC family protein [Clostridia bacterium]|nr:SoxR reducing system RseC family protein [Clostridia bacterium]
MTLEGFVEKRNGNMAEICLADENCGESCAACAGCTRKNSRRTILAENGAGADVGDRVLLSAPGETVATAAFLVFLLPVALAVGGYALVKSFAAVGFALGAAALGLALGVLFCVLYGKKLGRRSETVYRVTGILPQEEEGPPEKKD